METVSFDMLGFVLAVVMAVIGAVVSVLNSAPSRMRIIRDLEIIDRMSKMQVTTEEEAYLLSLRASVGKRMQGLVVPRKFIISATVVLVLIIITAIVLVYPEVSTTLSANPLLMAAVFFFIPFPLGWASGKAVYMIVRRYAEKRVKEIDRFKKSEKNDIRSQLFTQ